MSRGAILCPSAAAAGERLTALAPPGAAIGGDRAIGFHAFVARLAQPAVPLPGALAPFVAHAAASRAGLRVSPGGARGLARALSELHGSGLALDRIARALRLEAAPDRLVECLEAHGELLAALGFVDPGQLAGAAARGLGKLGPDALTIEPRIGWTQGELELCAALGARVPVRVELPFDERRAALFEPLEAVHQELHRAGGLFIASVDPAAAAAPTLRRRLEALYGGALFEGDSPLRALLLPTPEAEAREVVRSVRRLLAAGAAPDSIAVVGEGAALAEVERALALAGLTCVGGATTALSASAAGRAALAHLALADGGIAREPLCQLLATGLWPLGGRAGDRFRGLWLARQLREAGSADHASDSLLPPLRAQLARRRGGDLEEPAWLAETIAAFERGLEVVAAMPAEGTAPALAAALWRSLGKLGLLDALAAVPRGSEGAAGSWLGTMAQARGALAVERLGELLDGLAALGAAGPAKAEAARSERSNPWPRLRRSDFQALLDAALGAEATPSPRQSAAGIQLASPSAFLGRACDHLFLVGLTTDDRAGGRADPFLSPALRAALSRESERPRALAPGGRQAEARERRLRDYLLCCSARESLTASGSRLDASGRTLEPLELLREVARAEGRSAPESLDRPILPRGAACLTRFEVVAAHGHDARVRAAEPTRSADLLGARERELARRRAIPEGVAAPASGGLDSPDLLAALGAALSFPVERPLTPSLLSRLAACGFRALAEELLRIRAPGERGDQLDALEGGSLRHRCLRRIFEALAREGLLPLLGGERRSKELGLWLSAAREELDLFEKEGATGRPAVWAAERRSIERQLVRLYGRELGDDAGFVPTHFELPFRSASARRPAEPSSSLECSTPFGLRPSAGGAVLSLECSTPFGLRPSAGGAVLLLCLACLAATPVAGPRERLRAVGEELQQEAIDVQRLAGQESSLLDAIDDAERAEAAARAAAEAAEAREVALADRLTAARASEAAAEADARGRLRALAPRLRLWQRLSPGRRLDVLLGAHSAQEATTRERLLGEIVGRDLAELRGCLGALRAARADRVAAAALEGELVGREGEAERARAEARERRAAHTALLAAVRGERTLHERAQGELRAAQRKLSAAVAALPPEKMASSGFEALRGRLPRPVAGPIEVGFGQILNPRWSTVTLQKGVDIRAPEGTVVRAVHEGRVVHAGWFQGYGNLVIVDHGDGYYTLFAHLRSMERADGDLVATGEPLGAVGATGSLKGPYLYFEIRHHGAALDPSAWLASDEAEVARP